MILFELRRYVAAMEDQWSYELVRCVYVLPCKGAHQHIRRCTKESMTSLNKHKSTRSRSIGYRILTSYKTQSVQHLQETYYYHSCQHSLRNFKYYHQAS